MKRLLPLLLICSWAPVAFMSCSGSSGGSSSGSGYNPDVGPFDEDGNYVEEWADNPPKRGTKRKTTNPAPIKKKATPKPVAKPKPAAKPKSVYKPEPKPVYKPEPKPVYKPKPKPVAKPKPVYKPKPKPVVKPKPKPIKVKPKTVRHVVKKSDTLYSLSRKYGTTVSKIQKANGMRGTNIVNGTTLVIPR